MSYHILTLLPNTRTNCLRSVYRIFMLVCLVSYPSKFTHAEESPHTEHEAHAEHDHDHNHKDGHNHEEKLSHGDEHAYEDRHDHGETHDHGDEHGHADEHGHDEGVTELSKAAQQLANIKIETAGPQSLRSIVRVYGRFLPDEERVAHVSARFPGILQRISKRLGDSVEKGELLAVVESNQSLQPYEIRAQVTGTVLKRHATLGEFVDEQRELFVIADLSQVWADFQVYRDDSSFVTPGQAVEIELGDSAEPIAARISYVSPVIDPATQSKLIRAIVPNPDGKLRPGLFISGNLTGEGVEVAVAVRREAIQRHHDFHVVFVVEGNQFRATPVTLGRIGKEFIEIRSGLAVGQRYVSENSFVIKADIEKSSASHDH